MLVLNVASVMQKLITPLFRGPVEPSRNKVTVVGVGQVGMACAVSILLRVRLLDLCTLVKFSQDSCHSSVCFFHCLHQFHGYILHEII